MLGERVCRGRKRRGAAGAARRAVVVIQSPSRDCTGPAPGREVSTLRDSALRACGLRARGQIPKGRPGTHPLSATSDLGVVATGFAAAISDSSVFRLPGPEEKICHFPVIAPSPASPDQWTRRELGAGPAEIK